MSDAVLDSGGGSAPSGGDAGSGAAPSSSADSPTIDSIFDEVTASLGEDSAPSDAASAAPAPTPEPVPAIAAPPVATQPEAQPPVSPGEPPKERWDTILSNARTKAQEDTLQAVVQQYGDSLRVVEALRADPVGTVVQLMSELQANPQYQQQMASQAARTLRAARQQAVSEEEPQPDLDAGNGVLLYSAGQQAKREQWLERKWQQAMQQALAPVQQDLQQRQQHDQALAIREQAVSSTKTRLEKWAGRPHFTANKDVIRAKQAEYYKAGHDTWDALSMAYADVIDSTVLPSEKAKQQQQMEAQAAQKLRAASPNPSAAAPAATRRARDIHDAFALALGEQSA